MKKIFWIAAFSVLSLGGFAQVMQCEILESNTYCAEMKNGKLYLTHDGVVLDKDVKLGDNTLIHSEGVIETKDRFIVLKPDECVRVESRPVEPVTEPVSSK